MAQPSSPSNNSIAHPVIAANTWATDLSVPDDPDFVRLYPVGWRILIRVRPQEAVSKGGIFIPVAAQKTREHLETVGRVVGMGKDAYKDESKYFMPWCAVGNWVQFGKYAGKRISYGGVKYIVINEDEVLGVVPDPDKLEQ